MGRLEPFPITVLIPCYNDGETLGAAVQSAMASRVAEIIVVNDGSTDERTCEMLSNYAQDGVTVLHTENRGAAPARNHGLGHVTTEYTFNLDADDELLPGALERLHHDLSRRASVAAAWGDYYVFGRWNRLQETADRIDPWHITVLDDLPGSALFRTAALRQVGGWQADGYEDWDLWMSFAEHGLTGSRVPIPVFRYRTHPSTAKRRRARDEKRHELLLAEMRARHQRLFAGRTAAWLASESPLRVRVPLALAAVVPVSGSRRSWCLWRVNQFVHGRRRKQSSAPRSKSEEARSAGPVGSGGE